jgi:hypothetical protein
MKKSIRPNSSLAVLGIVVNTSAKAVKSSAIKPSIEGILNLFSRSE